jgi:hypothetical protein
VSRVSSRRLRDAEEAFEGRLFNAPEAALHLVCHAGAHALLAALSRLDEEKETALRLFELSKLLQARKLRAFWTLFRQGQDGTHPRCRGSLRGSTF